MVLVLAAIAATEVGTLFSRPGWMPGTAGAAYVAGSGTAYASNRVTYAHAAGWLATPDAALEREYFLRRDMYAAVTEEIGLHGVSLYEDYGAYAASTGRALGAWLPRVTVAYTNMVRDCADVFIKSVAQDGSRVFGSSLISGGMEPEGGWETNAVMAHACRGSYWLGMNDMQYLAWGRDVVRMPFLMHGWAAPGLEEAWEEDGDIAERKRAGTVGWSYVWGRVTGDAGGVKEWPKFSPRIDGSGFDFRNVWLAAVDTSWTSVGIMFTNETKTAKRTVGKVLDGGSWQLALVDGAWYATLSGSYADIAYTETETNAVESSETACIKRGVPTRTYSGALSAVGEVFATSEQMMEFASEQDNNAFHMVLEEDGVWLSPTAGSAIMVKGADEAYALPASGGVIGVGSVEVGGVVAISADAVDVPDEYARASGRAEVTRVYGGLTAKWNGGTTGKVYRVYGRSGGNSTLGTDLAAVGRVAVDKVEGIAESECGYSGTNAEAVVRYLVSLQTAGVYAEDMRQVRGVVAGVSATPDNPGCVVRSTSPLDPLLIHVFVPNDAGEVQEVLPKNGTYRIGIYGFQFTTNFESGVESGYTNVTGEATSRGWIKTRWTWKGLPIDG